MEPFGRMVMWAGIALVVLGLGCASGTADRECIHTCDVEWEACTMSCDRRRAACETGCADRAVCLDRCAEAHPLERQRCDDRQRACLERCTGG